MNTLKRLLPDAPTLLSLGHEELGIVLLQVLHARRPPHHFGNFCREIEADGAYGDKTYLVQTSVSEAWAWLATQILIAPDPKHTGLEWVFVTPRGNAITTQEQGADYRKASLLPFHLLHPDLAREVRATFLRGDYETAVFQAFKKVEVAVRAAGGFSATDIGIELMKKAFKPHAGALANKALPEAEQVALVSLAVGAIGSYKNPASHRTVSLTDPTDAIEMIMLASHLLRITESRRRA